ncbi:MAG: tyrosine-type recombinase/integrase, partial [Acidimicrobiales bacterium]
TWAYWIDAGRDLATDRRIQHTRSGFATKAAAESAMREALRGFENGTAVRASPTTLAGYLEGWLANVRPNLRPTTWAGYRRDVANITDKLGKVRMQDLTPLQIETAYAQLLMKGRAGRPLSPKSVKNIHTALRRALGDAERLGLIVRNPARLAKPPTYHRPEIETWTADELGGFLDHMQGDRLFAAYMLLATTGMRRGEVFGLRWSDVKLNAGWLSIEQTLTTVDSKLILGATKTARSRRRIALDAETITVLRDHKRRQAEERLTVGPDWQREPDLVFRELDGRPLHPDWFTKEFKRQARAAGLTGLRGPHGLRHTWATLALQAGIHPKVVSERLGHSTISITLDTYSHVMPGMDVEAANVVAAKIFGGRSA